MNKIKRFFLGIWTWIGEANHAFKDAGISIPKILLVVVLVWLLMQGCSFHFHSESKPSDGSGKPTVTDIQFQFNQSEERK